MKKARRYLETKGYPPEERQKILDAIRTDIPNSRLQQCKFLLGITRLYIEGQLRDGRSIANLNKTLKYVASDTHVNEYDSNLNGENLITLVERFSGLAKEDMAQAKAASDARQLTINNDYTIVPIDSPEEAAKYGNYVSWCVTHSEHMYDSYTNNGLGRFYFCLRRGFENEQEVKSEGCPLDNYGLSMIAVSVTMEGEVNTITCRWNHAYGGNDNIMTVPELEDLLGRNFYQTFKPYSRDELHAKGAIFLDEVQDLLDEGNTNPADIFESMEKGWEGDDRNYWIVTLNNKANLLEDKNYKLLLNPWADEIFNTYYGATLVVLNRKYNAFDRKGEYCSDTWFDSIESLFTDFWLDTIGGSPLVRVQLNNKYNVLNTIDGRLISNTWFDNVHGLAFADNSGVDKILIRVKLADKYNLMDEAGKCISKIWFDYIEEYGDRGLTRVTLNHRDNYIDNNGNLFSDIWFDEFLWPIGSKYLPARIRLNYKFNYMDASGKVLSDVWFDKAGMFRWDNSEAVEVKLNGKYNYVDSKGKLIYDTWFDYPL